MEKPGFRLSRRNALVIVGGAAVAMGAVLAAPYKALITRRGRELARAQPFLRRLLSLADAGYDEWLDQVGSVFAVGGGTGMSLFGVEPLNSSGARPLNLRDRAFLLHFNVLNGGTMAGDLIYTVSHPQYGPLRIFLSASTDRRTPGRMLAVFN